MLDESSIMTMLEEYAKSDAGKKKIKSAYDSAAVSGKELANGTRILSMSEMTAMGNAFAEIVKNHLPQSIESAGDRIVVSQPIKHADGSCEVVIKFDKDAIKRESLESDGNGYSGVDNIIALFNNGYHAKNYVYGWWNKHKPTGSSLSRSIAGSEDYAWVRSRKEREPLRFIQDAAAEFNAVYGDKYGVTVIIGDLYEE